MKVFAGVATLALLLSGLAIGAQPSRPNVVLIVADDLGYAETTPYGQQQIATPRIARLAKEGLRFTNFYAGATVCSPSRACLLTGMHGGRASIRDISEGASLVAEEVSIAEVLSLAGYYNVCIGKWHTGSADSAGHPILQGFDEFFGFTNDSYKTNATIHYPTQIYSGFKSIPHPENKKNFVTFSHDLLTDAALNCIERRASESSPFFLFLNYYVPHRDLDPVPAPPPSADPLHHQTYDGRAWTRKAKNKAAMISRMDRDVGRIVDLIDRLKIGENTLILFTSDNGPALNDGVGPEKPFNGNGALRSGKTSLYEGGIRVPFIARWPHRVVANATSDQVSSFADLLPTLSELAGLRAMIPPQATGRSFVPVLETPAAVIAQSEAYWQRRPSAKSGKGKVKEARAVRFGPWKAVETYGGSVQLFNLDSDPGESSNLAAANPEIRNQAVARLSRAHCRSMPRRKGVVAHWPFDEGRGSIALDTTGNAPGRRKDGLIGWTRDCPTLPGGLQNHGAVHFSKLSDRLITRYPGVGGGEPRTVACWIKTSTVASSQTIISWGKPTKPGLYWELRLNQHGGPEINVAGSSVRAQMKVADGSWHHLAITIDDQNLGSAKFYVDGKSYPATGDLKATMDTEIFDGPYASGGVSQPVIVGGSARHGFVGTLDDVVLMNTALDETGVQKLRAGGALTMAGSIEGRVDLANQGGVELVNHGDAAIRIVGYRLVSRNGKLRSGEVRAIFPPAQADHYAARTAESVTVVDSSLAGLELPAGSRTFLGKLIASDADDLLRNTQLTVALGDGTQRAAWLTVLPRKP